MIDERMQFEESAVVAALSSKRYLIEASVKEVLPAMGVARLFEEVQGRSRLDRTQRRAIDILKKQRPALIVRFDGLSKWTAEWWAATLCMEGAGEKRYFHILGWSNNKGVEAVIRKVSRDKVMLLEEQAERVSDKMKKEYTLDCVLENVKLFTTGLPKLPGLPDPEEFETVEGFKEKREEVSLDSYLDVDDEELAERVRKAGTRKKKVKVVTEIMADELDSTDEGDDDVGEKPKVKPKSKPKVKKKTKAELEREALQARIKERKKKAAW